MRKLPLKGLSLRLQTERSNPSVLRSSHGKLSSLRCSQALSRHCPARGLYAGPPVASPQDSTFPLTCPRQGESGSFARRELALTKAAVILVRLKPYGVEGVLLHPFFKVAKNCRVAFLAHFFQRRRNDDKNNF